MSVVVLENASLSFGPKRIIEDLNLRIADGDRIGLIGPNGSGKTTVLKLFAGAQQLDGGEVRTSRGARIGWLPQELSVEGGKGLLDFVKASVPGREEIEAQLTEVEAEYAKTIESGDEEAMMDGAARLADLHERLAHFETAFSDHEALTILAGLGFTAKDQSRDVGELSGGWKMRAVLASMLFQRPDVLLLDEPTNHLDHPVRWPVLRARPSKRFDRAPCSCVISHDRDLPERRQIEPHLRASTAAAASASLRGRLRPVS